MPCAHVLVSQLTEPGAADIDEVTTASSWGVLHATRALLPHLLARPEAALVNVSSIVAFVPVPGRTVLP